MLTGKLQKKLGIYTNPANDALRGKLIFGTDYNILIITKLLMNTEEYFRNYRQAGIGTRCQSCQLRQHKCFTGYSRYQTSYKGVSGTKAKPPIR
jgi:hypothetical protein